MDGCPTPSPPQAIRDLNKMACILEISHPTVDYETHFEHMSKMISRPDGIYHLVSNVLHNLQKNVKPKLDFSLVSNS